MALEVMEVTSQRGMQAFQAFPRVLYRDAFRAPPLPERDLWGPQVSPLYERVEAQPFLAASNGRAVGRIVASRHLAYPEEKTGFFGYFEALRDVTVASALVNAAARWLSARGMCKMIGPVDLTFHERAGMLVEGFGGYHPPGMPYNPPYYADLLTSCGLEKERDLYAYLFDLRRPLPEKLARVAARAARGQTLRIRGIQFADLAGEGDVLARLHNGSMRDVWGFIPLSPREGAATWEKLRGHYDPGLILVAEMDGKPAGLCLVLSPLARAPFFNPAGRIHARLAVLGVLPAYRLKGIEAALLTELSHRARLKGVIGLDLSLVAENNAMMHKIIQTIGQVKPYRRYRVFKKRFEKMVLE